MLPDGIRLTLHCVSVGVLLPPYDECSKLFLGQILTKQRKVLLKKDVPVLAAPKWPELALCDLWPKI